MLCEEKSRQGKALIHGVGLTLRRLLLASDVRGSSPDATRGSL